MQKKCLKFKFLFLKNVKSEKLIKILIFPILIFYFFYRNIFKKLNKFQMLQNSFRTPQKPTQKSDKNVQPKNLKFQLKKRPQKERDEKSLFNRIKVTLETNKFPHKH